MDTPRPDLSSDLALRVRRRFRPIMESDIVRCLRDLTWHLDGRTFNEQISDLARKRDKVIPHLVGNRESFRSRNVGNPHAVCSKKLFTRHLSLPPETVRRETDFMTP